MKAYLTLLILAAQPLAAQSPPAPGYLTSPTCAGIDNTHRCAKAWEARLLASSKGMARRDGAGLQLRLQDGTWRAILDDWSSPARESVLEPASYNYFGRLPSLPFYLLRAQFVEGNGYTLVHTRTGRRTDIEGYPFVSPNHQWLLNAEDGYYNYNGVILYQITSDTLTSVLEERPSSWVPGVPTWHGSSKVMIPRLEGDETMPTTKVLGSFDLTLGKDGWTSYLR